MGINKGLFCVVFQVKSVMSEELAKSGLYIDDFSLLRVLEPDIANETNDLKEECSNFGESKVLVTFSYNFLTSSFVNL